MSHSAHLRILPWSNLDAADRRAWRRLRATRASLSSPYFAWDWFAAIQAARGDLLVLRAEIDGESLAYLPFHRSPLGRIRPAGGPVSDWHGFMAGPDFHLSASDLVGALRSRALTFPFTPADDPVLAPLGRARGASALIDMSDGYAAYSAGQSRMRPKPFRNLRARERRLRSEHPEAILTTDDPEALGQAIALKSAHYRRTGQPDVLARPWVRRLLRDLGQATGSELRLQVSTLRDGPRLLASHIGLREGGLLHYWLPAYDPAAHAVSPGLVLLHAIARAEDGLSVIDLGGGDYRFKEEFANAAAEHLHARLDPVRAIATGRLATIGRKLGRRLELVSSLHEPEVKRVLGGG